MVGQVFGRMCSIVTARKRSLGQGNIFTPVCQSVHRGACVVGGGAGGGGVCGCWGGVCGCWGVCMVARGACVVAGGCAWLLGGMPGCRGGGVRRIRRDTVNERAVRILLECILVFLAFTLKLPIQTLLSVASTHSVFWRASQFQQNEYTPVWALISCHQLTSKYKAQYTNRAQILIDTVKDIAKQCFLVQRSLSRLDSIPLCLRFLI